MPRVPILDNATHRTKLKGRISLTASPDSFGAVESRARSRVSAVELQQANAMYQESGRMYGLGQSLIRSAQSQTQAINSVVQVMDNFIKQKQAKESESQLLDWETKVSSYRIQLNKDGGALTRKGSDAVGITSEVESAWDDMLEEMPDNPAIRDRAMRLWIQARENSVINASRVEMSEKDKVIAAQRAAARAATIKAFALAIPNSDGVLESVDLHDFQETMSVYATKEARQVYGASWKSKKEGKILAADLANEGVSEGLRLNILSQIAKGEPGIAKKMYDEYRHLLSVTDALEIEGTVQSAYDRHVGFTAGASLGQSSMTYAEKVNDLKSMRYEGNVDIKDYSGGLSDAQYEIALSTMRDQHYDQEKIREERIDAITNDVILRIGKPDQPPLTDEEITSVGLAVANTYEIMRHSADEGFAKISNLETLDKLNSMSPIELGQMGVEEFRKRYKSSLTAADFQTQMMRVNNAEFLVAEDQLWINSEDRSYELTQTDKLLLGRNIPAWQQQQNNGVPAHAVQSDEAAHWKLQEMLVDGSIADVTFDQYNNEFLGKLSYHDYQQGVLSRFNSKARNATGVSLQNNIPSAVDDAIDRHVRRELGLKIYDPLSTMNGTKQERYDKMYDEVRQMVLDWQETHGTKIDEQHMEDLLLRDQMRRFDMDPGIFSSTRTGLSIDSIEIADVHNIFSSDLTNEDKDYYNGLAARNGRVLTADDLERLKGLDAANSYTDIMDELPQEKNAIIQEMLFQFYNILGANQQDLEVLKNIAPDAYSRLTLDTVE